MKDWLIELGYSIGRHKSPTFAMIFLIIGLAIVGSNPNLTIDAGLPSFSWISPQEACIIGFLFVMFGHYVLGRSSSKGSYNFSGDVCELGGWFLLLVPIFAVIIIKFFGSF